MIDLHITNIFQNMIVVLTNESNLKYFPTSNPLGHKLARNRRLHVYTTVHRMIC